MAEYFFMCGIFLRENIRRATLADDVCIGVRFMFYIQLGLDFKKRLEQSLHTF